ncbi:hypothetical protein TL16_g11300 [Triparma laevis f. inornata]|uniref:Pseudouridine synthase RsuA/RluA-like domain-containing protein n=1 Tax=Triparma laevis f. inornata TaxID=1714386 RepID=A0A9W7BEF3_9STRA|nr:hypothetical protein TL16_g11300 [Triparma laevis f. inornata]
MLIDTPPKTTLDTERTVEKFLKKEYPGEIRSYAMRLHRSCICVGFEIDRCSRNGFPSISEQSQVYQSIDHARLSPTLSTLNLEIPHHLPIPTGVKIRPCHQLDYSTSGLILYSLSKSVNSKIISLFESRKIRKVYSSICTGFSLQQSVQSTLNWSIIKSSYATYIKSKSKSKSKSNINISHFDAWKKLKRSTGLSTLNASDSELYNMTWKDVKKDDSKKRCLVESEEKVDSKIEILSFMKGEHLGVFESVEGLDEVEYSVNVNPENVLSSGYVSLLVREKIDAFACEFTALGVDDPGLGKESWKPSLTHYTILKGDNNSENKVILKPLTGRRHQLRLVMNFLCKQSGGIKGDPCYNSGEEGDDVNVTGFGRMCLNAWILGIEEEGEIMWIKGEDPFGIEDL